MREKITDKDIIVKKAEEYLKANSKIDILNFIKRDLNYEDAPDTFITDVAYKMERTGKYAITDSYMPYYLNIKVLPEKPKTWGELHPVKYEVFKALITALFSLLVGYILYLIPSQKQDLLNTQQTLRIQNLSDSIESVQNDLIKTKDSLESIKNKISSIPTK